MAKYVVEINVPYLHKRRVFDTEDEARTYLFNVLGEKPKSSTFKLYDETSLRELSV